jgi:thioredoxin-related protein
MFQRRACCVVSSRTLMKKLIALTALLTLSLAPALLAADGNWQTDPAKALADVKGTKKLVLIDFTGSDWCSWCMKLNKEVFSQPEFQQYAKDNLVLVELDFPRAKPQTADEKARNEALAKKYRIEGFPTIVVLNSEGKQVGQLGYMPGGAAAFINALKQVPNS